MLPERETIGQSFCYLRLLLIVLLISHWPVAVGLMVLFLAVSFFA
jgi:hypothetical protein